MVEQRFYRSKSGDTYISVGDVWYREVKVERMGREVLTRDNLGRLTVVCPDVHNPNIIRLYHPKPKDHARSPIFIATLEKITLEDS